MRALRCLVILTGVLAFTVGSASADNIVLNGSFENGTYPGGEVFVTLPIGSTTITGWTVTGGTIDWVDASLWQAADGSKSLDMNGTFAGTLTASTSLVTVPNQQYILSFAMAGNPGGLPTTKTLFVTIDGLTQQSFTFDTTGKTYTDMGWETHSIPFTAVGPSTTLTFASGDANANPQDGNCLAAGGNSCFGAALDNVQVEAVPDAAATLLLLGMSLTGLAAAKRRWQ